MARGRAFAYETLLRIRRRQEDQRAMVLAAARREVRQAEEMRTELVREQQEALGRWSQLLRTTLDTAGARRYHQYERHLARLIDEKDADIRRLEGKAEEKRTDLLGATKEKRIVEKLKERQNAAHALDLKRKMQRAADETAVNYAAREDSVAPERGGGRK